MTTKIEWTRGDDGSAGQTWNPVTGCTKVSAGCDHCYAESIARRFAGSKAFPNGFDITLHPERLDAPLRWRKPRKVFVNSMSDLFHSKVPDEFITRVWAVMAATPQHTYQVLTKRHGRMRSLLSSDQFADAALDLSLETKPVPPGSLPHGDTWPLPNVWVGVSVEDQRAADLRIPALLDTPAAVRFLSCEPLLGEVSLRRWLDGPPACGCGDNYGMGCSYGCMRPEPSGLDWCIVGGESGPGARPMHPDWARSLRDQCVEADVPFFFKQWGEHLAVPVVDDPRFFGGRAYDSPLGGRTSLAVRERGQSGTFRGGECRMLRVGERTRGGVLLDEDTFAVRVGKKAAGRELDGRTWDEYPAGPLGRAS